MRDPDRVQRILKLIEEIWRNQNDLRLVQLIQSLLSQYDEERNAGLRKTVYEKETWKDGLVTQYMETSYLDGFYLEDEKLEEFLLNYLKKMNSPNS